MITEFFIMLGTSVAGWVGGLFSAVELPAWVYTSLEGFVDFYDSMSGLGAWTPWEALAGAVALTLAVFLAMFAGKLIRAVASYIPFVGGAG